MRQKQDKNFRKVDIARLRMEVKEKIDDLGIQLDRMDKIIKANERNKNVRRIQAELSC